MPGNIIQEFQGEYRFLSNFWVFRNAIVDWMEISYYSVECAYQAAKFLDLGIRKKISCMRPGDAKRAGKASFLREDWEKVKLGIMSELVTQKFDKNPDLARKLLATYPAYLQEGNTWGDRYWGVFLFDGKGENHLGKILMDVRDNLHKRRKMTK